MQYHNLIFFHNAYKNKNFIKQKQQFVCWVLKHKVSLWAKRGPIVTHPYNFSIIAWPFQLFLCILQLLDFLISW